jgi:hypothetical protein
LEVFHQTHHEVKNPIAANAADISIEKHMILSLKITI